MNRYPKISVITPSYNQGEFIEDTIKSVISQSYPNLEYIIIDGGSKDNTPEILKKYQDYLAYWVSEKDDGQTDALIKGFNRATGDIFCWLNSDDLFEPWTLLEVADFFRNNPKARFVYGDATWISRTGKRIKRKKEIGFNKFIWLYNYNYLPQPSCFWRADLYYEVGGLDKKFDLAMDADLWIRFAQVTKLYHVKRPWSLMRLYPEQKNQRLRMQSNIEDDIIRSRYLPNESVLTRKTKKLIAKTVRTGLMLIEGCYW